MTFASFMVFEKMSHLMYIFSNKPGGEKKPLDALEDAETHTPCIKIPEEVLSVR